MINYIIRYPDLPYMGCVRVVFKGKVQGVWFRVNCQKKAVELGVNGWVRNMSDGSVESLMEGNKNTILSLIKWCEHNQPIARVTSINIEWLDVDEKYSNFIIKK